MRKPKEISASSDALEKQYKDVVESAKKDFQQDPSYSIAIARAASTSRKPKP